MRFTKDITIGEIPTASNSNYSALFQADGQVRKRTLGSIITQDIDAYLSGISVAFPTSIFNIADSSITPSQPNLVVSLKNQLAGTVFAAPETLNGTPSFRKLADVDLSETTVAFQDDIPAAQNLSLGASAGQIDISGGTGVTLHDLNRTSLVDFNDVSGIKTGGFTTFFNTTGSLGYPSSAGQGIMSLRSATTQGSFALWVSNNDSQPDLYINVGSSSGWTGWKSIATNDQIPTNYITTNTNQTGLSGDKSTTGIWTFGNGIRVNQTISYGNDIRVRFSASNTVISANTTVPTNGIFLRPQGDTVGSGFGQVFIDGTGQINTDNHGNSSQWKQAYDWGDFRDYGLGTEAVVNTGLLENTNETGFYAFSASQQGFNYPRAILMKRGSQNYGLIFSNSGNKVGFLTDGGSVYTAWHSGNFNPSGYVPTSRTIAAGNGLSGGGNLTANRTITLGTPSAITLSSTNSVGTSSHTHAFAPGGTTAQYIRGDGSLATFPTSQDSIFAYSPQGGLYTTDWSSTALGQHSVAIGYTSVVTASSSISIGKGVFTGGAMSQNIGFSSNVNKALSANFGSYNLNNAELGNTFGQGLINQGMGLTVIGKYNQYIDHQDNMDVDDKTAAIQFGVGKDELTRRNAVTIYNDRRMDYDTNRDDTYWNDNTIPDIKWINENVGGGGGPGGNMNYAYVDPDNTHFFGNDMANGLLVPRSYIVAQGNTEPDFGLITIRVPNDEGFYGYVDDSCMYSTIGVSVKDDIIVTQGCIATATVGIALSLGKSNNLIYVWDWNTSSWSMSWVDTVGIEGHRHDKTKTVIVIGQMVDRNGKDYFNVNPQIV